MTSQSPTNLDQLVEQIDNPEALKQLVKALFDKISKLEAATALSVQKESPAVQQQLDRLQQIKYGITELTERMQRPYIMPSDLEIVVDTLETLAKEGDSNALIIEGMPGTGKTQLAYAQV
jgi:septation ring formation regulator EzrA